MNRTRIHCQGMTVAGRNLPPFDLRGGDFVCLHMPDAVDWDAETKMAEVLCGKMPQSGLQVCGKVVSALYWTELPLRGGFLRMFRRPRVAHWLHKRFGLSSSIVEDILRRHSWTKQTMIEQLPGTPKVLLALEAAWARSAEAIVFSASGLDPLGRQLIYKTIVPRLQDCPVIQLSHQFWTNGQYYRDCFPGVTCLEVEIAQDSSHATVPA